MQGNREIERIDKSTWGDGPWQDEPDIVKWTDQETGIRCMIVRQPTLGNLCGYIALPQGHPWYDKPYEEIDAQVHGGLTFASFATPSEGRKTTKTYWIGFDCCHFLDLAPGLEALAGITRRLSRIERPSMGENDYIFRDTYKDIDYVMEEVKSLAKQAAEAAE